MYEISKSFDFIESTLVSGDFTDFIEITVIVKSRKCLHTTSANLDIFVTWTCHVAYTSAHVRTCETSSAKPKVKPHFGLHRVDFTRPHVSTRVSLCGQVHIAKISELALVVSKHLRDFTETLYIVD